MKQLMIICAVGSITSKRVKIYRWPKKLQSTVDLASRGHDPLPRNAGRAAYSENRSEMNEWDPVSNAGGRKHGG